MRVLFLANHFNTGGITSYLLTLVQGYVKRGHVVCVATSGGDRVAELEALGATHRRMPGLKVKGLCHPGLIPAAMDLARWVQEAHIDILHPQTRVTQAVAALVSRSTGRPYVSTCHGFFKPSIFRYVLPLWGQKAVAVSASVARHLAVDLGVAPSKIVTVANGIDSLKFQPFSDAERRDLRARFGFGDGPLVGIIARLSDVKGHGHLIDAMNELVHRMPGVKCCIVGEGPMEDLLKAKVRHLGLEAAVIFSRVNGRPAQILPMFDVFAMPSLQEGLGLSAMEAQACGIPVVASRVGGLVEAVEDGVSGFLVPAGDHVALADALMKVLADRELAASFSIAGRQRMVSAFGVDRMVDATLDVYQKVMACA